MEHDLTDFGTGLLAYLRRSPHWVANPRELMRVAFAPAPEQPAARRTTWVALVPLVAGLLAELAS
ncbi:MAG: hypothetical protein H0T20_05235 [Actinobacteria bacterium]|nr:hypothetical protein [Actinomycetota bacterium]